MQKTMISIHFIHFFRVYGHSHLMWINHSGCQLAENSLGNMLLKLAWLIFGKRPSTANLGTGIGSIPNRSQRVFVVDDGRGPMPNVEVEASCQQTWQLHPPADSMSLVEETSRPPLKSLRNLRIANGLTLETSLESHKSQLFQGQGEELRG